MSIPIPPDLSRGRVSWTVGRTDGTTLPGARGTVRFEATAVAVAYSTATVLPSPVETPVVDGIMTPVDLLVNDPEVWNWRVTPRLGVTWEPFHIDVDGPVDLATAAVVPGKGPIRVVKGDRGAQGASLASLDQIADDTLRGVIVDPLTGVSKIQDYTLPAGPEGPYGGTAVTDPQVAALVTGTDGVETRAALKYGFAPRELIRSADDGREVIHIVDENPAADRDTVRLEDSAGHGGTILNIHHRSTASVAPQSYAINIANHPGAAKAFVIHQYSKSPAVQIDNTDNGPSLIIKNTENQTMNPGGSGTGTFMQFLPFNEVGSLQLLNNLTWLNTTGKDLKVQATNSSIYAFHVQADTDKTALQVSKNGIGAGNAVWVTNQGTGVGLMVSQNGTGTGVGMQIVNKGTGASLRVQDATKDTFRVHASGEVELYTPGAGFVMRSFDGTRYKVYMSNAGEFVVAAV